MSDILPFRRTDIIITPGAPGDRTPGVRLEPQTTRMGLQVVVAQPGAPFDGEYSLGVETAVANDDRDGEWHVTGDRISAIDQPGEFRLRLVRPVLDRVRLRIGTSALTPGNATFTVRWLADRPLRSP